MTLAVDDPAVQEACNRLGWPGLRRVQQTVLEPLLAGKDVVCVLPTSGGKTGIYQIPALCREGMVVVVSPLVALMHDQVSRLEKHGICAVTLNSHASAVRKRQAVDLIRSGAVKLLYLSPERLLSLDPSLFDGTTVQMWAIDEAHCISEWGHDFRPSYYRLGRSLDRFPAAQRVALTATATGAVQDEIASVLGIRDDFERIVYSPDRPNISYGVAGRKVSLVRLVQSAGLPCLVYGSTRKSVEDAASALQRAGYRAAYYHAGMKKQDRTEVQERFQAGDYEIIAATCAFGMGIDHAGIRAVVHLEMPTSLEAYSQETGRAGRDGAQSKVLCRSTVETLDIARASVPMTWPSPQRVRLFWRRLRPMFRDGVGQWHGATTLQLSNTEIAHRIGMDAIEVGSCIRILSETGNLHRTPYRDRPVQVSLLSTADRLTGRRQRAVVQQLRAHADLAGEVVGSVAFFRDVIGLDKAFAQKLNLRHAIRFQWVDRCQVLELAHDEEHPTLDGDRLVRVRQRAFDRIEAARGFLYTTGCRRRYLLEYFGDRGGGRSTGICCDRCMGS